MAMFLGGLMHEPKFLYNMFLLNMRGFRLLPLII